MIELVYGDEVIPVKEHLTIKMYQEIYPQKKEYEEDPIKMVSLFTGLDYNKLKNLQPKTMLLLEQFVLSKVQFQDLEQLTQTFIHNGIEYGLDNDFGKLAWGAWVDLEVYSSEDIQDNLHRIMSILYRPIIKRKGNKYTIEPYNSDTVEPRAIEFLELPLGYWLQASDFFFLIVNSYIGNIKASLEQKNKMTKLINKGMKILPKWVRKKVQQGSTLS